MACNAVADFTRGHLGLSALLLALEPGTSVFFLTESLQYPRLRGGERTKIKRAAGATHILAVSVQCRLFFVLGNCLRYAMLLELLSLPIDLSKDMLTQQLGFASPLAEPRPGMFPE